MSRFKPHSNSLLLRQLLQYYSAKTNTNQGYTLPLMIALGLIMMIVGLTMFGQSQNQQVSATLKRGTAQSMAVTEAGVTNALNLINSTPYLAIADQDQWSNLCNPDSSFVSLESNGWKDSFNDQGQYQIKSYIYNGDGTGTLEIEGSTGATSNPSTSALRVSVDLGTTGDVPAVILNSGTLDQETIDSNILLTDCNQASIWTNNGGTVTGDIDTSAFVEIPEPEIPTGMTVNLLGDITKDGFSNSGTATASNLSEEDSYLVALSHFGTVSDVGSGFIAQTITDTTETTIGTTQTTSGTTSSNLQFGISHVIYELEDGSTIKIDEYGDVLGEQYDPNHPEQFIDVIEEATGQSVTKYTIKAGSPQSGGGYYNETGENVTQNIPDGYSSTLVDATVTPNSDGTLNNLSALQSLSGGSGSGSGGSGVSVACSASDPSLTLPQSGHTVASDGNYYYQADSIDLQDKSIDIDQSLLGNGQVIIEVDGDIKIGAGVCINKQAGNDPGELLIYGTNNTNFLGLDVNAQLSALIIAPQANVGLDDSEFAIDGDELVTTTDSDVTVEVLGASITYGAGGPNVPVTTSVDTSEDQTSNKLIENTNWGDFDDPINGNVNTGLTAGTTYSYDPTPVPGGTTLTVSGKSWNPYNNSSIIEANTSQTDSPQVMVLRNGDQVPNVGGFGGQDDISSFLSSYINNEGEITINKNQAIYLMELGTTDLSSSAADFQDLVVLVTVERDTSSGSGGGSDAIITGALWTNSWGTNPVDPTDATITYGADPNKTVVSADVTWDEIPDELENQFMSSVESLENWQRQQASH